jgi:hypothetical protein
MDFDVADATGAKDKDTRGYNIYFDNLFGDLQHQIEERMRTIKLAQIRRDNGSINN